MAGRTVPFTATVIASGAGSNASRRTIFSASAFPRFSISKVYTIRPPSTTLGVMVLVMVTSAYSAAVAVKESWAESVSPSAVAVTVLVIDSPAARGASSVRATSYTISAVVSAGRVGMVNTISSSPPVGVRTPLFTPSTNKIASGRNAYGVTETVPDVNVPRSSRTVTLFSAALPLLTIRSTNVGVSPARYASRREVFSTLSGCSSTAVAIFDSTVALVSPY